MDDAPPRGNPKMEWGDYMNLRRMAFEETRLDKTGVSILGNEYRLRSITGPEGGTISYIPKMPPAFDNGVYTNYDPKVMPLASVQDPNYWYAKSDAASKYANVNNENFKLVSSYPPEVWETPAARQMALDETQKRYQSAYAQAEQFKDRSLIERTNYHRQVLIQRMRDGTSGMLGLPPNINATAELAEQAARDYEQASASAKPKALANLNKYLGNWNELAGKLGIGIEKGRYLLSNSVGNIPMIADAGRLMGGGGIGVSPDGLPMIQSKSEMQQDAGVPEELRNSFRVATDDEMANYRREAEKRDAENRKFEELGKVLLQKETENKMKFAEKAGNQMINKMSGNSEWNKILGYSNE